jgi:hypothetical protein
MATFSNTTKSFLPHAEVDFLFSEASDFLFSDGSDFVFQEYQGETPWVTLSKHTATWANTAKS